MPGRDRAGRPGDGTRHERDTAEDESHAGAGLAKAGERSLIQDLGTQKRDAAERETGCDAQDADADAEPRERPLPQHQRHVPGRRERDERAGDAERPCATAAVPFAQHGRCDRHEHRNRRRERQGVVRVEDARHEAEDEPGHHEPSAEDGDLGAAHAGDGFQARRCSIVRRV